VLGAGRPDCPFCGNPVDPSGHLCVRANGFKRREPRA
jgi:ribosomal protein L24E